MISHALMVETYSRLTAACIAGLWQGAVLALLAACLLRLMPRASATLRHTVLVVIFAIAAVLPWLRFAAIQASPINSHGLRIAPWVAAIIAAAWLALASIRATALILSWQRLKTVRQRATPVVLEGVDRFHVGVRDALLCVSPDVDSPTIVGFRGPRLLLPDWMAPLLTPDDLRQIALHECEHLRRHDDWLNLLLQIGLVLSPLNPALVWLNRRIGTQRELACDAAVVALTAQPIPYATCLTRLAEQRMNRNHLMLALAAMGRSSELGERVHALLTESVAWTHKQSRLATVATAAVLVAGSVGLAKTPLFVRIAAAPQAAIAVPAALGEANDTGLSIGNRMPYGVRAVPASFIIKPVAAKAFATHLRRRQPLQRKTTLTPVKDSLQQPRMMRTSALVSSRASFRTADAQTGENETAIRFVPAEYSSSYVAVPVANGWLIFQL